MKTYLRSLLQVEQGQDLIGYTLLLAFVVLTRQHCSSVPTVPSWGSGHRAVAF